jgi:hypothetical protein
MAVAALLSSHVLQSVSSASLAARVSQVLLPAVCAIVAYVVAAAALKSRELDMLLALAKRPAT